MYHTQSHFYAGLQPQGLRCLSICIISLSRAVRDFSHVLLSSLLLARCTLQASVQMFMHDYHKAHETYKLGLKIDPGNKEFELGMQCCKDMMRK